MGRRGNFPKERRGNNFAEGYIYIDKSVSNLSYIGKELYILLNNKLGSVSLNINSPT